MIDEVRARELHEMFHNRAKSMAVSASRLPRGKRSGVMAEAGRYRDASILIKVLIHSGMLAGEAEKAGGE